MKTPLLKYLLVLGLILVVILAWTGSLDASAKKEIDAGLKRSLVSFTVARGLNALISVAQGTEFSIAPVGFGVTLAPGQILDPANDLIEQFSELMLYASIAFGILKILVTIGGYWIFPTMLTVLAVLWGGLKISGRHPSPLLTKMLIAVIFVRFSVPLVALGNEFVYKQFLEKEYQENQLALETGQSQLESLGSAASSVPEANIEPVTTNSAGFSNGKTTVTAAVQGAAPMPVQATADPSTSSAEKTEKSKLAEAAASVLTYIAHVKEAVVALPQKLGQVSQKYDPSAYVEKLKELTAKFIDHVINLIVVFVLQTIVIPLIFMWGLYRLFISLTDSLDGRVKPMRSVTNET